MSPSLIPIPEPPARIDVVLLGRPMRHDIIAVYAVGPTIFRRRFMRSMLGGAFPAA